MRYVLLTALLLVGTACGERPETSAVSGQLLQDGKPLANILVTFIPERTGEEAPIRSMAMTDSEGKFQLRTETRIEGALLGSHRVILEDLEILHAPRSENGTVTEMPAARFHDRYKSIASSPLKADVAVGANQLKLEISKN